MPQPQHPVWGSWLRGWYEGLALGAIENTVFLGWTSLALVLWGRPWRQPAGRFWSGVLAVFGLMALGPFLRVGGFETWFPFLPFQIVRFVPIVEQARIPSRFAVLVMLALSVLVALAISGLRRSGRLGTGFAATLILLVAFEALPAPFPISDARVPATHRQIAESSGSGAVLVLPFSAGDGSGGWGSLGPRAQSFQREHGRPLLGGYLARLPPSTWSRLKADPVLGKLVELQSQEPSAEQTSTRIAAREFLDFLHENRVEWVSIDQRRVAAEAVALVESALGGSSDRDGDFELWRVASSSESP